MHHISGTDVYKRELTGGRWGMRVGLGADGGALELR